MSLLDLLQPQANAAAITSANAALDSVAQRPFSVVLSVDDATKMWLTLLVTGVAAFVLLKR